MRTLSDADIRDVANSEGIDPNQLLGIAAKENSNDESISQAGARGRFQLLPATFKSVNPTGNIDDPRDNAVAAARYLKQGLAANGGDFAGAAAQYYAGPAWKSKIEKAPGVKYGTNPDGSGGISIEDYQQQATQKYAALSGSGPSSVMADGDDSEPDGDADDLNAQIVKVANLANQQLDVVGDANASLSSKLAENTRKQMDAVGKDGELQANMILDKQRQQMTQAGQASAELSRLGINTDDLDSTIAQISVGINEDYQQAMQMRQSIDAKRSINILDDPIGWIGSRLTLPSEIAEHNAIIQRMNAQKDYVDKATNIAATVQSVNAAKFTSMSWEGATAAAEVARNQAQVKALDIQDKALRTDFETQARTLTIIQTRMGILSTLENRAATQGIKQDQQQAKNDAAEKARLDDMQVSVAAKMIGMDVDSRKALDKMPKDSKNAIEYIMANGGGVGREPLEALQVLQRGNPQKMAVTTNQQRILLGSAYMQAQATMSRDPVAAGLDRNKQSEYLNREMQKTLDHAWADPNYTGLKNNPYKAPSLDTMRQYPGVAGTPLIAILDDFRKQFPNRELSDSQIAELAYANIGKLYKDPTEAAKDVSRYYKGAVDFNNKKMQFSNFGLKDQEDYKVQGVDLSSYSGVMKRFLDRDRSERGLEMLNTLSIGMGA